MVDMKDVVFILMLTVQPAAAVLSLTGSNSYIENNKEFVLTCSMDSKPYLNRATFYKDESKMIDVVFEQGVCYGLGINGVTAGFCDTTQICNCTSTYYSWTFNGDIQNEEVLFICYVPFQSITGTNVTLLVPKASKPTTGPYITQFPSGPIDNGETVSLTCVVLGGVPFAALSWECEGFSFEPVTPSRIDNETSTVQLVVNSTDNQKTCKCEATHPLWNNTESMEKTITVYYKPLETLVLSVIPAGILSTGNTVNATCYLRGGNPLVTLTMSCNGLFGSKFNTNTTAFSVVVFAVNETFNGKKCVCTATHPVDFFKEVHEQTIEVQYAPTEQLVISQSPATGVLVNNSINLTCEVTGGNPLAVLSWDCGVTHINNTANNTASYTVSFTVSKIDNGKNCTCTASHPVVGYIKTKHLSIVVYYPPENELAVRQSPLGPLDAGDEVTLTCDVTGGNPLAELSWDCGRDKIKNISGNTSSCSVRIQVDKSYNGRQCNCSATHLVPAYRPTKDYILIVLYQPSIPSLTINPDFPLFEGNSTILTCHVTDAGNPQSNITWTWNHTSLHTSIQNTLKIGPMKKSDNGAIVSCRVENEYSIKKELDIQVNKSLNIEYNPIVLIDGETRTFVEGQTVNIKCVVFGNPTPTSEWFRMEETNAIVKGGQELNLTIFDIDRHAKGRYTCKAGSVSDRYGELMSADYIELIVNYPPNVSINYSFHGENERQATYQCNAKGNPNTYTYTGWIQTYYGIVIRSSEKLLEFTQDNNKKLILSQLSYEDSGNYTCFVNNGIPDRHGKLQQFSKEQLDFKASPVILSSLPPDDTYSTTKGGQIAINLKFLTFPDLTEAFWYRNKSDLQINKKLPDGIVANIERKTIETTFHDIVVNVSNNAYNANLNISNLEEHMEGAYVLVLRNGFKDKNVTIFVVISSKPDDPSDLNVTKTTSTGLTISWKRGYSGGHNQSFNISVFDNTGIRFTQLINDNYTVTTQIYTITDLDPSTEYVLHLYSENEIGKSKVIKINTTTDAAAEGLESTKQEFPVGAVVGVLTGVLSAVLVVIVIIYIKRRCSIFGKDHESTGRKKLTAIDKEDEEDNGLKDNILYESAGQDFGSQGGSSGVEYAVVTKNKDKFNLNANSNIQETTLYSEVRKICKAEQKAPDYTNAVNPKKIKKQTKGKKNESSEEVYENMSGDVENKHSLFRERKENKDGLVYADLVFNPSPNGPRFIHGEDDRTIYADVDTTQKIDPLPESDGEETTKDEQIKVADK